MSMPNMTDIRMIGVKEAPMVDVLTAGYFSQGPWPHNKLTVDIAIPIMETDEFHWARVSSLLAPVS